MSQATLSAEQIEAFYHQEFVEDQVRDFRLLAGDETGVVVDIGGGYGFFAKRLTDAAGMPTRVLDTDPKSVANCRSIGIDGRIGDALAPDYQGDEDVVSFNLILHHLVARDERTTRVLQVQALKAWHGRARRVFVNEYIYESAVENLSGRLIYEITSSKLLSAVAATVAKFVPSLRANTFGVGVRFRARKEWFELFKDAGFRVVAETVGTPEPVSVPQRGLLIKTIRRDSYLLEAA